MAIYHIQDGRYKGYRFQILLGFVGIVAVSMGVAFLVRQDEKWREQQRLQDESKSLADVSFVDTPKKTFRTAEEMRTIEIGQLRESLRMESYNQDWWKIDELARRILKLDPEDGEAWNYVALANEKGDKPQEAVEAYSKAIDAGFIPSFTLLRRAAMYRALGNYPAAIADLQESARVDPQSVVVPNLIMISQIQAGEVEKVRKAVANFETVGVTASANQYLLGKAALALHDHNSAKAAGALAEFRASVEPVVFGEVILDPYFAPWRNDPALVPFFFSQ